MVWFEADAVGHKDGVLNSGTVVAVLNLAIGDKLIIENTALLVTVYVV